MISLFCYTQLRFYYTKLLDTTEQDHQVLGFINPVVDSDDEDDNMFEPERGFSGVFNSFVNQWCVKKYTNVFKLELRFHAFPEILEMLETDAHVKFNFQHPHETKMLQTIVFWSTREIKMPGNSKTTKKNPAKLKCCESLLL